MLLIEDVLIDDALFQEYFICNISVCKGLCCIKGDYGAPVTNDEIEKLKEIKPKILSYMEEDSKTYLESNPVHVYFDEIKEEATPLHKDGRCVYAVIDPNGIVGCGIEKAWADGVIDWRKPISCHLYPIRIEEDHLTGFKKLNYSQWDICAPACSYGKDQGVKVYEFLKEAIIRRFDEEFYQRLDDAAKKKQY